MTAERISDIYAQLDAARVTVDASPERGPAYLQDLLQTCRRMQDELTQVYVEVVRAFADVKQARRASHALVRLSKNHPESVAYATALREFEEHSNQYDALQGLITAVAAARGNLRATDSDIRLSATIMDQQIKLGQIRPPRAMPTVVPIDPALPQQDPVAVSPVDLETFLGSK